MAVTFSFWTSNCNNFLVFKAEPYVPDSQHVISVQMSSDMFLYRPIFYILTSSFPILPHG